MKRFEVLSDENRQLQFILGDSHTYVANALRRTLLSDIRCSGIENAYISDTQVTGIHIHENTGRLHNEFLSHRLSMIPLALDPKVMQVHTFKLKLTKET